MTEDKFKNAQKWAKKEMRKTIHAQELSKWVNSFARMKQKSIYV